MYDYVIEKPELSEETLMHYGVRGMKWGIRKQRPILDTRRFRTGTAKPMSSNPRAGRVKPKKKRKGYSDKDYQKYKAKGMTHKEAEERARKDRKKKIKKVALLAAGLTLAGAYAYKKSNTPYKGETREQMYERKAALKARNEEYKKTHYKYKNQKEFEKRKAEYLATKNLQAKRDATVVTETVKNGIRQQNVSYKPYKEWTSYDDKELSRYSYERNKADKRDRSAAAKRRVSKIFKR